MAFFTRVCKNGTSLIAGQLIVAGLIVSLLLLTSISIAANFTIRSVETRLENQVYLLDANLSYEFPEPVIEALQSGIPLRIIIDIMVEKKRNWWFDTTIGELQQEYILLYHALTERYIVTNINSRTQKNYVSLNSAIVALNKIEHLPILDAKLINAKNNYYVRLKTHLDIEYLPAPMRPIAYVSSDWQLESNWYQWPLQQ